MCALNDPQNWTEVTDQVRIESQLAMSRRHSPLSTNQSPALPAPTNERPARGGSDSWQAVINTTASSLLMSPAAIQIFWRQCAMWSVFKNIIGQPACLIKNTSQKAFCLTDMPLQKLRHFSADDHLDIFVSSSHPSYTDIFKQLCFYWHFLPQFQLFQRKDSF